MPIYCYICPICGDTYEDVQTAMVGGQEVFCKNDYCSQIQMDRDFHAEKPAIIADWEPGYNIGIDESYSSKADLMAKIRRKGYYPKLHGGTSVKRADSGLYGDEEFRKIKSHSEPADSGAEVLQDGG